VPAPRPGVDPASAQRKGDKVADDALELLRTLARQRFFLWVHFYDPHYPYESSRVPDMASPAAYADEVAFMDGQIGRILEELRKLGVEQNTLVVLVGDHGEGLNDHDEYQHGFFVYEAGLHVPLILHCPGVVPAGRQSTAVVRTVDVAPTILELSGLPPLGDVQGTSLKPLIAGQVEDLRLAAYGEALEPHTLFRLSRLRSLIQGTWKYIHSSQPRLYDLANDPAELHDVVVEKAELAAALREQLRVLLAEAPPPLAGETHVDLTTNELARLETLGYLGVVSDPNEAGLSELDTFAPAGADPHPHARVLAAYERARDALGHNRFDAAEGQLRAVLASLPESPAPLRDLAFVLGRQAKVDEAVQTYEHALAITPADTATRAQYASLLMDAQRWDAAIAQSKQVLTQVPDDVAAHSMLGVALAKLERLDEAQSHLEAAVRVDPRNLNALYTLGQVYYKRHMLPEAADCFRQVLALEPRAERARAALQTVEREMQR
jgi:tetratricopeptide (TPR) repeat protein